MGKTKAYLAHVLTALLIPCIAVATYYADLHLMVMYQRFEISSSMFAAWRIGVALFDSLAALWIASRALQAKRGSVVSITIGLIVCVAFGCVVTVYPIITDFGLLSAVLICSYVCSLIVALAGRYIA